MVEVAALLVAGEPSLVQNGCLRTPTRKEWRVRGTKIGLEPTTLPSEPSTEAEEYLPAVQCFGEQGSRRRRLLYWEPGAS
jgi:hypothetical protein